MSEMDAQELAEKLGFFGPPCAGILPEANEVRAEIQEAFKTLRKERDEARSVADYRETAIKQIPDLGDDESYVEAVKRVVKERDLANERLHESVELGVEAAGQLEIAAAKIDQYADEMEAANQTIRDRPDIHYQILDSLLVHGEAFVYDGEVLDPAKVVIHRKRKESHVVRNPPLMGPVESTCGTPETLPSVPFASKEFLAQIESAEPSEDLKEAVERRFKSIMRLVYDYGKAKEAGSSLLKMAETNVRIEIRKLVESGAVPSDVEPMEALPFDGSHHIEFPDEPERVVLKGVKFESGTWPVCCNKEMKYVDDTNSYYCLGCGRTTDLAEGGGKGER